jgi:hypothetical protein
MGHENIEGVFAVVVDVDDAVVDTVVFTIFFNLGWGVSYTC